MEISKKYRSRIVIFALIFFLIVFLLFLVIFFWPKPMGGGCARSYPCGCSEDCLCLGFQTNRKSDPCVGDHATVLCYGLPIICNVRHGTCISQDKSMCAAMGIELLNLPRRQCVTGLDFMRENLSVKYLGEEKSCDVFTQELKNVESQCQIGSMDPDDCFVIQVNSSKDACYISYKENCWSG